MLIREFCGYTSALGTHYETLLYKERFVNFLEGTLILSDCCSYGVCAHRTTLEGTDNSPEYLVVYGIKAALVYIEFIEGIARNLQIYMTVTHNL